MRIVLCHLPDIPDIPGGHAVGTLDGMHLALVGREAYVEGASFPRDDRFQEALYAAVEAAAGAVFGSEWSGPLAIVTGLNRRACQKDRVRRDGLPARILKALAWASSQDRPRAFGHFLLGTRHIAEGMRERIEGEAPPALGEPNADPEQAIQDRLENAILLVRWLMSLAVREKALAASRKSAVPSRTARRSANTVAAAP